jgi:hypothetical protein
LQQQGAHPHTILHVPPSQPQTYDASNGITIHARHWSNPQANFDNIGSTLYALYEVSTLDKWLLVAHNSMDITEIDLQPSVDNEPFWCFFYILFIVCSNFYLLNLFVGTVYEKYILIRDSGVEDLTKPQRHWVLIMEHIRDISPHKGNRHPNYKLSLLERVGKFSRSGAEDFVESRLFEEILIGTIIFNCIVMALTYHGESESWSFMLTICNQCCLLVFTAEVFFKVRASSV